MGIMWDVTVIWPDGNLERGPYLTTQKLKTYLDTEVFCLKHDCLLPQAVYIRRDDQ